MKKLCRKLHLWLGLLSGIVVFVVCITGCLYVFKDEIQSIGRPWETVKAQNRPFIQPSQALAIANKAAADSVPDEIAYGEATDALRVDYFNRELRMRSSVYLNPYTGQVLKIEKRSRGGFNFFHFLMQGHRSLWLPYPIGHYLVAYGVLVFFIVLVTGLVIWLPKRWNKKVLKQLLTFRRPLKFDRFNRDLHVVLGFYMLLPLIVLCFTGLMMALEWFSQGAYAIVSGGGTVQDYTIPASDTLGVRQQKTFNLDKLYRKVTASAPTAVQYSYSLPTEKDDVYSVTIAYQRNAHYRVDNLFFDQYTLKPLSGTGPYVGRYKDLSAADAMMRMNFSLHDGSIWGIWGKMIMFLASLTGASLPVTGLIIWLRKKRKNKQPAN